MKIFFASILFSLIFYTTAQNSQLANQFYSQGDYDKAAQEYQSLLAKYPYNKQYLYRLVQIYQKQGKYEEVDKLLNNKKEMKTPSSMVWLGYNYLLRNDSIKASVLFDKAIEKSMKSSYMVYQTGKAFQEVYQLDKALVLYTKASKQFPDSSFLIDKGKIYAEKNDTGKMIEAYLDFLEINPQNLLRIRYFLTPYISASEGNRDLDIIKRHIIERISKNPLPVYYRLLEWFYVQEQNYKKAFMQLRSLYAKNEAGIEEIFYLGNKALEKNQAGTATRIFKYVKEHAQKKSLKEKARLALLKIKLRNYEKADDELDALFETYTKENWEPVNRKNLLMLYSDYLAFYKNRSGEALEILDELLKAPLSRQGQAQVKLKKGDIYMQQGLFNKALILFTQVQLDFPNHHLGRLATYKIAQASFFKGDIEWAHNQLKVIKTVHSDLISNDAIDLDMLIINNKQENDSLQTALKNLAKIKYLIFKNKKTEAITQLDSLKTDFKGQSIYDDILWIQGNLFEEKGNFDRAMANYTEILNFPGESLYKDDALFRLAGIYEHQLGDISKAKNMYKQIITDYPGSFWFTDARKAFRRLRGDDL